MGIVMLVFILWHSCAENPAPGAEGDSLDPFIREIKSELTKIETEIEYLPMPSAIYQSSMVRTPVHCHEAPLIIMDDAEKSIQMINRDGELLARAGGEGRGPEEFLSFMWSHVGADNRLYVIDGLQFRISIYEIEEKTVMFNTSVSYENPLNYFLARLYVTDIGRFGVYQESEGFMTPENRFYLYSLNENFEPAERLLELPGNERQRHETPHFTFYTPYVYRTQTIWDIAGEWFFYTTTAEYLVYGFNLKTGKRMEFSFFPFAKRHNNRDFINAVKEHSPVEDEEYWDVLEDIRTLPFFAALAADGNRIFRDVSSVPGEYGITIVADINSGKEKYFLTPGNFIQSLVCGDTVYGIDYQPDGNYRLAAIRLLNE